jgi:tripartite-type tricarboxylate transporter receptor subunit TctC
VIKYAVGQYPRAHGDRDVADFICPLANDFSVRSINFTLTFPPGGNWLRFSELERRARRIENFAYPYRRRTAYRLAFRKLGNSSEAGKLQWERFMITIKDRPRRRQCEVLVSLTRWLIVIAASTMSLAVASAATPDGDYPSRVVRLIVPFAPGGPTDIAARIIGNILSQKWGQSVIVENRPGGGTVIGTAAAIKSPPDGYTLLFGVSSALVENSFLMRELPYDPLKSFSSITEIYKISAGLSVNTNVPVKTIQELVALAKTNPLSYSSFGIGTGPHLLLETFKKAAGVNILHVPYKGNVPGLAAVVAGEVDMTGAGHGTIRPFVQSGQLRLLAVGDDQRSKFAPDVPTFKELGYPDVGAGSQFVALWAPSGTPKTIIGKINRDVTEALATPRFSEFLENSGYDKADATLPGKLDALTKASLDRWGPILKALNIHIDN